MSVLRQFRPNAQQTRKLPWFVPSLTPTRLAVGLRQKHLNRFYSIFAPRPFGQLRVPRFLPALEQTNSKEETRLRILAVYIEFGPCKENSGRFFCRPVTTRLPRQLPVFPVPAFAETSENTVRSAPNKVDGMAVLKAVNW